MRRRSCGRLRVTWRRRWPKTKIIGLVASHSTSWPALQVDLAVVDDDLLSAFSNVEQGVEGLAVPRDLGAAADALHVGLCTGEVGDAAAGVAAVAQEDGELGPARPRNGPRQEGLADEVAPVVELFLCGYHIGAPALGVTPSVRNHFCLAGHSMPLDPMRRVSRPALLKVGERSAPRAAGTSLCAKGDVPRRQDAPDSTAIAFTLPQAGASGT